MVGEKRRLCIVMGGHFAGIIGGAPYQAKCLVDVLARSEEFETFYLARHVSSSYVPHGYEIVKIVPFPRLKRSGFLLDMLPLDRLLKGIEPDVIYQRGLKCYTGVVAHYAMRNKCKSVFHVASDDDVSPRARGPFSLHMALKSIERRVGEYGLRRVDEIVVQTKQQSDLLKRNYGRRPTAIIPNFHPPVEETIEKQEHPLKVVWVGNFKSVKRPEIFVQLAEDLAELDGVQFIMIGRPGDLGTYGDLHKKLSSIRSLKYLGERPLEDVNRIIASAHVLVNTSVLEGFPNTFIQAWLREVPVVSLNVNSDGIFNDRKVGLCGGTYEGMKSAVVELLKDKELRHEMGRRGHTYAMEHHSTDNVESLISILR